jgi:hypothetical protein
MFNFKKKKKEETKPLPTYEDLFRKAEEYVVECGLRQFISKNEVTLAKGRFIHGYEQAIKDFVDPNYKPK